MFALFSNNNLNGMPLGDAVALTAAQIARATGRDIYASIGWVKGRGVRFRLLVDGEKGARDASFEDHDTFIERLLRFDPAAKIETAKATYYGLADFREQVARDATEKSALASASSRL